MIDHAQSLLAFSEQFKTLAVDFTLPTTKRLALATTLLQQAIANGAFKGPEWLIIRSLIEVSVQDDARRSGAFRDVVDWLASHGDQFEILAGFDWPRGDEILLMNPLAATLWHLSVVLERFANVASEAAPPPRQQAEIDDRTPQRDDHKKRLKPVLSLNSTAKIALLNDQPIELNKRQTEAMKLLFASEGAPVSFAAHGIRTRDVDPWPEQLAVLIEAQPGGGTRLMIENVDLA